MKKISKQKKNKLSFRKEEFTQENIIEGGLIRPLLLLGSLVTFIVAMFLMLFGNLKWGGSLIIISFIFTLYSIYLSFTDDDSVFRTMNLILKFTLFTSQVLLFNYLLYVAN